MLYEGGTREGRAALVATDLGPAHLAEDPLVDAFARAREVAAGARGIVVFDIDGVLADPGHRLSYILTPDGRIRPDADWDSFFATCDEDRPISEGLQLEVALRCVYPGGTVFLSGRRASCRQKTVDWLERYVLAGRDPRTYRLILRPPGDRRPDYVYKTAVLDELRAQGFRIEMVVDDSQSIVDAALTLGLRALHFRRPNVPADSTSYGRKRAAMASAR